MRDRDASGRPHNARPRDALGRPLARDADAQTPVDAPALAPIEALQEAQRLLDSGHAFAAHEVLEAVWKATEGPERALWRGLAQLAVGLTHRARGNEAGAHSLLLRGADSLASITGTPWEVHVNELRAWATAASTDPAVPMPRLSSSGG